MQKIVEIKNLQKNFGKFQALKNVTLDVNAGEVLGYIGPNGSGKSTTIRVLLGIIKKSGGSATIFGKDVWTDAIEIHKKIAYVPGDVYLWPNLSGGEIIDLFLKLHGHADLKKRDELIKKFELDPKKKARSYSKGNRQKIALIAALATDAELYIFDEPTSGLDPLMESVFQAEVQRLKKAGKAIILSSHILSEVERLADRVAVIRKGEIVETGSLDDLRHLTRDTFKVETNQAPEALHGLEGVHDLHRNGNKAVFQVDSDKTDVILKTLLKYGVKKLESTPPTLEELFMHHYE
ncbi:MAG TPA: ABC transporter ATP-binding protein [Lactococcus sp.]|uniref:ABC transporter ATP-binding protein n=1 Tax=Lactococcus TaxID=1357 RepID=UPI000E8E291B|nr:MULTISPECIES: ABC transporter ATP-binding protein [Lactococcus]HBC90678.1 ABC transporter ATP-binding protein [Lactococcus sp.]